MISLAITAVSLAKRATGALDAALATLRSALVERQNRLEAPERTERFIRLYQAAIHSGSTPAGALSLAFALTGVGDPSCIDCGTTGTTWCGQCETKDGGRLFV